MNCKDCVYYELCQNLEMNGIGRIHPKQCDNFKDKSRFVELPCKVGDIIYKVSFVHKNVTSLKVEGFLNNLTSWRVHCTHLIPSWIGNQKKHLYIAFSSFGKTVFLTLEDAEEKLKEMKG